MRISSRQSSGLKHTSHWTWVTPSSGRGAGGFCWELVYSLFLMKTTLDRCCLMPGQCWMWQNQRDTLRYFSFSWTVRSTWVEMENTHNTDITQVQLSISLEWETDTGGSLPPGSQPTYSDRSEPSQPLGRALPLFNRLSYSRQDQTCFWAKSQVFNKWKVYIKSGSGRPEGFFLKFFWKGRE